MGYTKTKWSNGDTITAEKLNNIEYGIAGAENNVFMIEVDLDQNEVISTISEIIDAYIAGKFVIVRYIRDGKVGIALGEENERSTYNGGLTSYHKFYGYTDQKLVCITVDINNASIYDSKVIDLTTRFSKTYNINNETNIIEALSANDVYTEVGILNNYGIQTYVQLNSIIHPILYVTSEKLLYLDVNNSSIGTLTRNGSGYYALLNNNVGE